MLFWVHARVISLWVVSGREEESEEAQVEYPSVGGVMNFCIACQIGSHELCEREPECDCECQKALPREFSKEQQRMIDKMTEEATAEGIEP